MTMCFKTLTWAQCMLQEYDLNVIEDCTIKTKFNLKKWFNF